jgi:hypothetical protein
MSWAVGFDYRWKRDIGYGVPAKCDHPDCNEDIDRGLSYVCGGEPYGGDKGCGLFFCAAHKHYKKFEDGDEAPVCQRCGRGMLPFIPKDDMKQWKMWKLTDKSWAQWRTDNNIKGIEDFKRLYLGEFKTDE